MGTLAEFHSLVSGSISRGTSQDAVIPGRVRMAARVLERNFTFQYMRRWLEISVDVSAVSAPHVISLGGVNFKAFERVAIVDAFDDEGRLFDLQKIDPRQRATRKAGSPSSYWLDGVANLILDAIPEEDFTLEINAITFSSWGSADAWTHWLLDNAEDALLAQSMMLMAIYNRDDRLFATYKLQRDEALKTLDVAEGELANTNTETFMSYSPYGDGTADLIQPGEDVR